MELISHPALAHLHPTGPHVHPESPERIRRLHAHFGVFSEGAPATRGQVERVHAGDYIEAVDALRDDVWLDGDTFEGREKASQALEALGDRASGELHEALKHKPSLEAHRRLQALLARPRPSVAEPESLWALRGVAVLEDIGTPQARKVLETLAAGAAGARLTREAKAALRRLARP